MLLVNRSNALIPGQPVRSGLSLLTFTADDIAWTDVSALVATFTPEGIPAPYSITGIPSTPDGYIIAVRYSVDGVIVRFKLWSTGEEVLNWPLYVRETLPADAVFELWTCEDSTNPLVMSQVDLEIGILNIPETSTWNLTVSPLEFTATGIAYP